jgi:hypothetical protein
MGICVVSYTLKDIRDEEVSRSFEHQKMFFVNLYEGLLEIPRHVPHSSSQVHGAHGRSRSQKGCWNQGQAFK